MKRTNLNYHEKNYLFGKKILSHDLLSLTGLGGGRDGYNENQFRSNNRKHKKAVKETSS